MTRTPRSLIAVLPLLVSLSGCGTLKAAPEPQPAVPVPNTWHAPLPHGGEMAQLTAWWQRFDDSLLSRLILAGQAASPTIASAKARIAQARANRVASGAAVLPSIAAGAGASRGREELGQPAATGAAGSIDMSWEIDLFGAGRAGAAAAQARLEGATADWHGTRVLIAAEVAANYLTLRACEARLAQARIDAASRHETLRLNVLSVQSGMQSPGNAALSRASAAQADGNVVQQRAQCDLGVKSLVALTAIDETELRAALAPAAARLPQPPQFGIDAVPAQVLAQRPDLFSAAREVQSASAEVTQREAQRFPRISLTGSIGRSRSDSGSASSSGATWSIGPISVSLPLFDGGIARANVDAARARYEEAATQYRGKLRTAVREVEEALVRLQSTSDRALDAMIAADGFSASFRATEARWRGGLASLFELEDARRSDVQAQMALIELQHERGLAWVALYRAVGGGWDAAEIVNVSTKGPQ